jgi:uncharacterized RDD family membrane protein YckC
MESTEIDPRFPRVGQGRRMLGLLIDWLLCNLITVLITPFGSSRFSFSVYILFVCQYLFFTILGGATPGHRFVGLRIVRFSDGQLPTPKQALIRTALLAIVVTAITFDENGRGINERFSGTVLIRKRKN